MNVVISWSGLKIFAHAQPLKHIDDGLVGWRLCRDRKRASSPSQVWRHFAPTIVSGVRKDFFVGEKDSHIFRQNALGRRLRSKYEPQSNLSQKFSFNGRGSPRRRQTLLNLHIAPRPGMEETGALRLGSLSGARPLWVSAMATERAHQRVGPIAPHFAGIKFGVRFH